MYLEQSESPTAKLFSRWVDGSRITQRELAKAAGMSNSNVISMYKTGTTKIPVERIPALADALGMDRKHLMRVALQEYYPKIWEVLLTTFNGVMLTEHEAHIVECIREGTNHTNPKVVSRQQREALNAFIETLSDKVKRDHDGSQS